MKNLWFFLFTLGPILLIAWQAMVELRRRRAASRDAFDFRPPSA